MSCIVKNKKEIIMREKLNQYLETFIGKELLNINLACEMMCFDFGNMSLHASSFTRVLKNNEVLVTTLDYQSWDGLVDTNNDLWRNVDQFKHGMIGNKIEWIELSPGNDLFVYLENGFVIQSFVANGPLHYSDCWEQWRFLVDLDVKDDEVEPLHIVGEGKEIRFSE